MNRRLNLAVAYGIIGIILLIGLEAQGVAPFTPLAIRAAYDVNQILQSGYTGKGVTVAIIGENIGESFYSDVKAFSNKYGLPAPDIAVVQAYGGNGTAPTNEIAADTELVHAMAPDAKILLVLTGSQTTLKGFSYVIDHNAADIATMSFLWYYPDNGNGSASDQAQSYNYEYAKSIGEKITLVSVSADFGSNNTVPWAEPCCYTGDFWAWHLPNAYLMPQYSPYVTIVGGTALAASQNGTYSEVGWSQSGGGPSNLFGEPSWQTGPGVPQNHQRNIPDIALDASCDTPYAFDWNGDDWFCGTSAGAPTFAGIMADIDQAAGGRVGFLNPLLYSIASTDPSVYHDVTSGCSLVQVGSTTQTGYCAHSGWNFVTGWGSIDASKLAKHLAPKANIVPGFPEVNIVLEFPTGSMTPLITAFMIVTIFVAVRKKPNSFRYHRSILRPASVPWGVHFLTASSSSSTVTSLISTDCSALMAFSGRATI